MSSTDPIYAGVEPDKNFIIPFQLERAPIRGRFVRLNSVVNTILHKHNYPPLVAHLLAEMLALTVTMSSILKNEGLFTLQTSGDGPIKFLVADLTEEGHLRGYAEFDKDTFKKIKAKKPDLKKLLGKGHIAFTVDPGGNSNRYQGIVALEGKTLAGCIEHYFNQSVQVPTAIRVTTDARQNIASDTSWRVGCLLLQKMPLHESDKLFEHLAADEVDDAWTKNKMFLETATADEMVSPQEAPHDVLFRLFNEDGVIAFLPTIPTVGCRCSRDRVIDLLRGIPADERKELSVNGKIIVTCQFCNTEHIFEETTFDKLYGKKESDA